MYINVLFFSLHMIARLIMRIGLAIVFLWMGIDKIINPTYWIQQLPIIEPYLMIIAGVQIAIALLFLTRFHIISALIGGFMLGGAAFTLGLTPNAVRDVGLLFACASLLLPWEHHLTRKTVIQNYYELLKGKRKH